MAKKLRYIQIQPDKDFLNGDFLMLSTMLRGIYLIIKMYLYTNNGVCELNYGKLSVITNCRNFKKYWPEVENLFTVKNDTIRHKDVTADLRRARKCMKARHIAGLKGAQVRWQNHCERKGAASSLPMAKDGKVNETESEKKRELKPNSNSTSDFSRVSSSISLRSDFDSDGQSPASMHLKFYDLGCELLGPASQSDRTCIRLIADWLRYQYEKTGEADIFSSAWRLAQESKRNARKPMAMFMSLMKTELGYRKLPKEVL